MHAPASGSKHVERAAQASHTAAQLARLRFQSGLVDFLQVLDAERTQLEARTVWRRAAPRLRPA